MKEIKNWINQKNVMRRFESSDLEPLDNTTANSDPEEFAVRSLFLRLIKIR